MSPLLERARAELDTLGREIGLVVVDVLQPTDKSLLVAGTIGDQPIVAKLLINGDAFWQDKLGHEITVYRVFAEHPPPIRVPRLIHADDARLLVLERLDGAPLDADRYPNRVLPDAAVDAALEAVTALNCWRPPQGAFAPVFDYRKRIDRYLAHGILTEVDTKALHRLLDSWSGDWELDHGDPLPSNLLLAGDGYAALLDWEFTGLYLPGFDLALLHTLLTATPHTRNRINRIVTEQDLAVPFTINLAMVLTREIRTHRELPNGPLRDQRLPLVDTLWTHARDRLHTLAAVRR
ncbi:MAG: phosphotransferase [Pseudonocardiaceae bacterium]